MVNLWRGLLSLMPLYQLRENSALRWFGLIEGKRVPPALFKPACEECSLFEICLPKATSALDRLGRAAKELFKV
jgi:hypothetical protein